MSDEVRATSSTGGQKGTKPQRYDLVPVEADEAISEVYAFGAEKYDDHNWRKGYPWSQSYAALQRHLKAFWRGETYDLCPEDCSFYSETGPQTCRNHSGLQHLAHAGFHINALLTWTMTEGEGSMHDDRYFPDGLRPLDQALLDAQRRVERAEAALKLPPPDMLAEHRTEVATEGVRDWDPEAGLVTEANGWEPGGYIREGASDDFAGTFTRSDIGQYAEIMNKHASDLAEQYLSPLRSGDIFTLPDEAFSFGPTTINWNDPTTPTETMRIALGLFSTPPPRFVVGAETEDVENPISDEEAEYLRRGWIKIAEQGRERIYADPDIFTLPLSNPQAWLEEQALERHAVTDVEWKHNGFATRLYRPYFDNVVLPDSPFLNYYVRAADFFAPEGDEVGDGIVVDEDYEPPASRPAAKVIQDVLNRWWNQRGHLR